MNGRKVNLAFLLATLLYYVSLIVISFFLPFIAESLIWSNVICEMGVVLPGILMVLLAREKPVAFLHFKKIRFTTFLAIIPFTMFTMPLITVLNLLSQFLVDNQVVNMMESYQITEMPFWQVFLLVGIFAPFCEEVACRGIYYRGYRKSGSIFAAMMLSALLFAFMHMNLNQAAYAFAVGILAVLLVEVTGSLWSSIFYHAFINGSQVIMMFVTEKLSPDMYTESVEAITTEVLIYGVSAYLLLAAITLPLAWALLVWMSGNEGKQGILSVIWKERKKAKQENENKKDKLVTVSLILALILCFAYMLLQILLPYLLPLIQNG